MLFCIRFKVLNLWMKNPVYDKLTAMHAYSWKKGLKTGIYYLRTKAKAAPQQFTIEPEKNGENKVVIIISTVLPGTIRNQIKPLLGKHTKLCYNPFFIAHFKKNKIKMIFTLN